MRIQEPQDGLLQFGCDPAPDSMHRHDVKRRKSRARRIRQIGEATLMPCDVIQPGCALQRLAMRDMRGVEVDGVKLALGIGRGEYESGKPSAAAKIAIAKLMLDVGRLEAV